MATARHLTERPTRQTSELRIKGSNRAAEFEPDSPPLLESKRTGRTFRQIHPEHKATIGALEKLLAIYNQRAKRISKLCGDGNEPVSLSVEAHPVEGSLRYQIRPASRGTERRFLMLEDDRPRLKGSLCGSFNHHSAIPPSETVYGPTVASYLRATADRLRAQADAIERDLVEHPEHWQPLPSLEQFIAAESNR